MAMQNHRQHPIKGRAQLRCARFSGLLGAVLLLGGIVVAASEKPAHPAGMAAVPPVWGKPVGTSADALEPLRSQLGRRLFYDNRLSANGCRSCASCHQQAHAFTDTRARAVGATGLEHPRNTPTLTNVAYSSSFTWVDAKVDSLESQAQMPLFGRAPVEMGMIDAADVEARLRKDPDYPRLFREAFPQEKEPLTFASALAAIASFERLLVSARSPFDRYVYEGDEEALTPAARRGMDLFFSARVGCSTCHHGWNLSGAVRTLDQPNVEPAFLNNGLLRPDGTFETQRFKIPTVRNVAVTAPYMHDGSMKTLEEVIRHYESGGGENPHRSQQLRPFTLTEQQRSDLVSFLNALTDEQFLTDPALADPVPDRKLPAACERLTTRR